MRKSRAIDIFQIQIARLLLAVIPNMLKGRLLLLYLYYLARVRRILGVKDSIRNIEKTTDGCFQLTFTSGEILLVPQVERITRFVSGFDRSLNRIWQQYKMGEFETSEFSVVLDVGANLGEFSLAAMRKLDTKVVAIEPVSKTYRCLQANLEKYRENSQCYNFPLGNREEEIKFFISDSLQNSSAIQPETSFIEVTKRTKTLSRLLNDLQINLVHLMKMDAEGFEPEVLEGLGDSHERILNFTIDCSPERLGQSTLEEVSKYFIKNGIPFRFYTDEKSGRVVLVGGRHLKIE